MTKSNYSKILDHFKSADPILHKAAITVNYDEWLARRSKVLNSNDYFLSLCREIVGQQLSTKAASSIFKKFENYFEELGGITPENILNQEDQQLRDLGLSWAKVKYIKDLASKVKSNELNLELLRDLNEEEIIKELTKVKGIGIWTVEMFLLFNLQRENIFSHGDLGLKKGFSKLYKIENPTKVQIEEIITKWHPYKSYGSIALWHVLDNDF